MNHHEPIPNLFPSGPEWQPVSKPLEGYFEWFVRFGALDVMICRCPEDAGWYAEVGDVSLPEGFGESPTLHAVLTWVLDTVNETRRALLEVAP